MASTMTQRNFELIAEMVADICEVNRLTPQKTAVSIAIAADYLQTTNQWFKRDRFEKKVLEILTRRGGKDDG